MGPPHKLHASRTSNDTADLDRNQTDNDHALRQSLREGSPNHITPRTGFRNNLHAEPLLHLRATSPKVLHLLRLVFAFTASNFAVDFHTSAMPVFLSPSSTFRQPKS